MCRVSRIAVIDTGCNIEKARNSIKGYTLVVQKGIVKKKSGVKDSIGHGTAVTYIIDRMVSNAEITMIKYDSVFVKKRGMGEWLLNALQFIYENEQYDIMQKWHQWFGNQY